MAGLWLLALSLLSSYANAIPAFNRQTGQNCVACHAGGQFPELTPYGRIFKLTGYTIGQRAMPISVMAVASLSRVANSAASDDPAADFQKNGKPILATASLLLGGKLSDNLGGFAQITYDPYALSHADGSYSGHSGADNIDIRWADRFITPQRDLIVGLSLNNNPSVSDPWNTAAAWMQYVPVPSPGSSRFIDGNTPYPGFGAGGNIAGLSAYALLDGRYYAELGGYRSANGLASVLRTGVHPADRTLLRGLNPYLRLAYNREWGAHNLMLGASAMDATVYADPLATADPAEVHRYRDLALDAQYQYLLDPHAATLQWVVTQNRHRWPASLANQPVAFVDASGSPMPNTNAVDLNHLVRLKLSYVYQARYGGSLGVFNLSGSRNTAYLTAGLDPATLSINPDPLAAAPSVRAVDGNRTGSPQTRGATLELFWSPLQNMRIGAQYTAYDRYSGLGGNFNGFGRNASDNNSLFTYVWLAY